MKALSIEAIEKAIKARNPKRVAKFKPELLHEVAEFVYEIIKEEDEEYDHPSEYENIRELGQDIVDIAMEFDIIQPIHHKMILLTWSKKNLEKPWNEFDEAILADIVKQYMRVE